jgi:hypothetical protein
MNTPRILTSPVVRLWNHSWVWKSNNPMARFVSTLTSTSRISLTNIPYSHPSLFVQPSQPGPLLTRDDCPVVPDPVRQKVVPFHDRQTSICSNMDSLRYFVFSCSTRTFLCISRPISWGCATQTHRLPCGMSKHQAYVSITIFP